MTTTTTAAARTEVLNLRVTAEIKQAIAEEGIRDGRSMSDIAVRALKLGLAQMIAPTPAPQVEAAKAAPAKAAPAKAAKAAKAAPAKAAKGKGKGK